MDAQSSATFTTVEEHGDIAESLAPRPASCFGNCGACGAKLSPDGSPKLLPCLHSLCQQCVGEDRKECPVCGVAFSLSEVIDNFLFQKSQQITQCGGCGGAEAGGWCLQCGEALCPECISAHKRVRVTREHAILPQRPPTVSAPTLYCSTHREEPVKLVCQPCDQATCRECQLTFHRNHRYQFLHEAVAEEKDQIGSLLKDLVLQRQEVRKSRSDLDRRLLDVKELQNKLYGELRDAILSVRDALQKRAMSLAAEVQELCGSERRRVLERQEVLKKLEERQAYLLSFTKTALDTEGYSALLSCRRKIQSQLRDVMSHAVSPGDHMMNLTFHRTQDPCSQIGMFGEIVVEMVAFACTNENAVSKNPQPHSFSTAQAPPTSSHQPPPDCDDSFTSSRKSGACSHTVPSASNQTSSASNSQTSARDATASCRTLIPSQTQMAYAHISTISSVSLPTASCHNPSTSYAHPPVSTHAGLSLPQMLWPSYAPPAISHSPVTPCLSIPGVSNPNLSSRPLILSYLVSTFPVLNVPLFSPVTLHSLPLNTSAVVCNPLLNGQTAGTPAIETVSDGPCSQTSPTAAPAAVSPEVQRSSESVALAAGLASPPKDQTTIGTHLTHPVKAVADSPCEKTSPAGDEREKRADPAARENEPTSTMVEPDVPECTGDPSEEEAAESDADSAGEVAASRAVGDSPVRGLRVRSLDSSGVDLKTAAHSPGNTESTPQNHSSVILEDQSDHFGCRVEEVGDDGSETDSADKADDQKPRKADRRLAYFLAPATGRTEKHANPVAMDTRPTSTVEAETDGAVASVESDAEVARHTGVDTAGERDRGNDLDRRAGDREELNRSDAESFQGPVQPDERRLVPRVSLVRLPVSFPPPGHALPQFRLIPGANKQDFYLWQIPEGNQSSFAKCPSRKGCRVRRPSKRKGPPLCRTAAPVIAKRAKSVNTPDAAEIPQEDYLWTVTAEIRKECEKSRPNADLIKGVLKETFKARRAWIDGQPSGKILPILKPYPCFRLGTFIMSEFAMLLGGSKFDAIPQRAEDFLNVMESMMGKQREGQLRMLPVLSMIEENTKFEKGTSESVITVCKGASPTDVQLDTREMDPPRLVLRVTEHSLLEAFIVGDTMTARTQASTVQDAVLTLLGTYYTFHLHYPRIFSQALGFLQHHLLGEAYAGPKSNGFKSLSEEFVKYRKILTSPDPPEQNSLDM